MLTFKNIMYSLIVAFCGIGLYFAESTIAMMLIACLAIIAFYFNTKK